LTEKNVAETIAKKTERDFWEVIRKKGDAVTAQTVRDAAKTRLNVAMKSLEKAEGELAKIGRALILQDASSMGPVGISGFRAVAVPSSRRGQALDDAVGFLNSITSRDALRPSAGKDFGFSVDAYSGARSRQHGTILKMESGATTSDYVHEIGHFLEGRDSDLHRRALDYLAQRTKGERLQSLRKLTGKTKYDASERAWPDKFLTPYFGKDYQGRATEIVAMALECLYSKPYLLAEGDSEMFDWILGILWRKVP
jgi:hypothetical protein